MDIKEIKTIIDLMTKNQLSEFELEREGFKIRIGRDQRGRHEAVASAVGHTPVVIQAPALEQAILPAAAPAAAVPAADTVDIKSPMVGTFYRSPAPDAPAYVQVGQEINEETVVCIIEAMKVMNEIKAEVRGVVTEILAENAKAVEYNMPLFRVRKTA